MTQEEKDIHEMELDEANRQEYADDGWEPEEEPALPNFAGMAMEILNRQVAILQPNYTFTFAPMDELCKWFKMHTGTWADIKEIKKSFDKRRKKGINDEWMQRFYEAIRIYGPTSKHARVVTAHNKVPLIGRTEIAKALTGASATLNINYVALGSGSNVPADGDIALQTEFARGGPTNISYINNVAYIDKFFWSAEAGSQTINEVWLFMGATATPDSWILLSRVNISEVTTANETMTINATITLTSAL